MRQKTNSIRISNRYNSVRGSFLWILLLLSYCGYSQKIVEERIHSQRDNILIEFDLIDHIEIFNGEGSEIIVHAEGQEQVPNFQLGENETHIVIKGEQVVNEQETFEEDKVCSVEPNYASYQIYIPKDKVLFISFKEGNFYADGYHGVINFKAEGGIVKLSDLHQNTHIELNTGSIFVNNIVHQKIDALTNLGQLATDLSDEDAQIQPNSLKRTGIATDSSLRIRATMANIYLYGSKG